MLATSGGTRTATCQGRVRGHLRGNLLPRRAACTILPSPRKGHIKSKNTAFRIVHCVTRRRPRERGPFGGHEVLIVRSNNSDGEIPRCSTVNGLFSPIPERLPSKEDSALFSRFVMKVSKIPSEVRRKVLILSNSMLLLFGPLRVSTRFSKTTTVSVGRPMTAKGGRNMFLGSKRSCMGYFLRGRARRHLQRVKTIGGTKGMSLSANTMLFNDTLLRTLFHLVSARNGISRGGFQRFYGRRTEVDFCKSFLCPLTGSSALRSFCGRTTRKRLGRTLRRYEARV